MDIRYIIYNDGSHSTYTICNSGHTDATVAKCKTLDYTKTLCNH